MSDSALVLLNGIARGFRDSIVGMVRVYQMDRQPSDEVDSGEGSASEETPTVLARRRAARKKRTAASSSKDRFVELFIYAGYSLDSWRHGTVVCIG